MMALRPKPAAPDPDPRTTRSGDPALHKILVVDEDAAVHAIAHMVLRGLRFEGRAVQLLHARSTPEALALFAAHAGVTVALVAPPREPRGAGERLIAALRADPARRPWIVLLGDGPEAGAASGAALADARLHRDDLSGARLHAVVMEGLDGVRARAGADATTVSPS